MTPQHSVRAASLLQFGQFVRMEVEEFVPSVGRLNPMSERKASPGALRFHSESTHFNQVRSFLPHWHDECQVRDSNADLGTRSAECGTRSAERGMKSK